MNDQEDSLSEDEDVALPICPRCFKVMHGRGLFCMNCGSKYSNLDPYGHVATLGDVYREASSRPRNLITVIAMWIWLGPLAIIFTALFGYGIANPQEIAKSFRSGNQAIAMVLFVGLFGSLTACAVVLLYRTTRNYLKLNDRRQ